VDGGVGEEHNNQQELGGGGGGYETVDLKSERQSAVYSAKNMTISWIWGGEGRGEQLTVDNKYEWPTTRASMRDL
jgi:hypothetical protein